jgi:sulfur carrier protein
MQIQIRLNGRPHALEPGQSLADLLAQLGLAEAPVAVERNESLVRRDLLARTALESGDRVEIVTLVGGG